MSHTHEFEELMVNLEWIIEHMKSRKLNRESLQEIKSRHLEHAKGVDFLKIEENSQEAKDAMEKADKYFEAFVKQRPGSECVCCGKRQGCSGIGEFITGGGLFKWGIAHGEGFCSNCGYPARAIHYIDGVGTLNNFILQYHPDWLSFDKKEQSEQVHP